MISRATQLGWRGEEAARAFLERRGFLFVASRFRTREGELDLVMQDGRTLVVVEVKTRRNRSFGRPEEAMTARKMARLELTTERFLAAHPEYRDLAVRFDAVMIERQGSGVVLRHFRGLDPS